MHANKPISIHALREEGDFFRRRTLTSIMLFLSTPSARRATGLSCLFQQGEFISIHALREEGDQFPESRCPPIRISIHALREEGDWPRWCRTSRRYGFLSTPSARRATTVRSPVIGANAFLSTPSARRATTATLKTAPTKLFLSTPSARRATAGCNPRGRPQVYFYPRPPRGGRQQKQR